MPDRKVLERIKSATVAIAMQSPGPLDPRQHPFRIVGTGFCISSDGIVITCEHVSTGALIRLPGWRRWVHRRCFDAHPELATVAERRMAQQLAAGKSQRRWSTEVSTR